MLALLLEACSTTIPNAEVCADKGSLGAKCAYTRTGPDTDIKKIEWDKMRLGWFCMDPKDFGKYQLFIEDACAKQQNCIDEVNEFVQGLRYE